MREQTVVTHSKEETHALGETIGKTLSCPTTILLFGELGSGKTTFVQGLAKGLRITQRIISPTFIIVRTYGMFYHVDLYRVQDEKDIQSLGLLEILSNPNNIVAIEWAEKMGDLLPKERWDIEFSYISDNKRKISIRKIS
ncbi:MAG: tRNA (adenosine(37)-N6)-threonylcarbamoyltransferase complex ATPase subunit type 1 TsaE [Candidatus Levybacteria bacterium RIFCSPHIGHO2_02_FULL_42_12]|nr:MAG: tRNA (adenosine(37)-N6)-threonylcarbamoyltransferase complex ATPase subunit type 1 TsaE [Candidatus Levybacteria bacterium RIFCSPHIGHO2_02_FULL_42_12]OGH42781.1 MAG: tRNA (adenosine(37)-N6)-threonylcarbamoyltransferase complex ATPase subunit type 1 TsaE [Candidatus Levybacteria bacterium RIFCSPLOWO2_01_FULL_42_15]